MNERSNDPGAGNDHGSGRILVVDDSPDNVEILSARLKHVGHRVSTAMDGESALAAVREQPPDLILLDVMLPGVDGYEVARRIKRDGSLPFIPIILVTARDSTQDKVTGLDAGADDYLPKPINYPELEARVRSMLRIKRLQDELEEKNAELERLSISDGLTGLYNHRHIHAELWEEFERVQRTQEPLALTMLDIDHFKHINDTYGHQAGDAVLEQLAQILRETAREIDKLGRYGGEEFMALLPDTDLDAGEVFAERVRKAVEAREFDINGDTPVTLTISAGVATCPHSRIGNPELLVDWADRALYQAKKSGRNRVVRAPEVGPPGFDHQD